MDIPKLLSIYNEVSNNEDAFTWLVLGFTLNAMEKTEMPSSCSNCGNCKKICPQNIDVPEIMRKLSGIIDKKNNSSSS